MQSQYPERDGLFCLLPTFVGLEKRAKTIRIEMALVNVHPVECGSVEPLNVTQ